MTLGVFRHPLNQGVMHQGFQDTEQGVFVGPQHLYGNIDIWISTLLSRVVQTKQKEEQMLA